jgi:hypothetical protein
MKFLELNFSKALSEQQYNAGMYVLKNTCKTMMLGLRGNKDLVLQNMKITG